MKKNGFFIFYIKKKNPFLFIFRILVEVIDSIFTPHLIYEDLKKMVKNKIPPKNLNSRHKRLRGYKSQKQINFSVFMYAWYYVDCCK